MRKAKEPVILKHDNEDDDDKFLISLENRLPNEDEEGTGSYLDLKKKEEQRKMLKVVDHALEKYEPITKNLYIEAKEITRMTDKEVAEFKKQNGDIKVRGLKCPKPIANWY